MSGGRVEGDLAVSRGLGDFRFKQLAVVLHNTQLCPPPPTDTETTTTTSNSSSNTDPPIEEDETATTTNTNYKQYVDAYISTNASTKLKSRTTTINTYTIDRKV